MECSLAGQERAPGSLVAGLYRCLAADSYLGLVIATPAPLTRCLPCAKNAPRK